MWKVITIAHLILFIMCFPDFKSTNACIQTNSLTKESQSTQRLPRSKKRLRVATTTSLYDTGLWEYIEPVFEKKYGIDLDILPVGTGIALEYGRRGDVDVITVHSKSREQKFVEEGYGMKRVVFAYNYFIVVGPPADPAKIKGMSPEEAFRKLATSRSFSFVSRGDDSGTHSREIAIWKGAGVKNYDSLRKVGDWYIESGRGMGPTLLMADELQGYTLTDLGTFLAFRGKIELVPLIEHGQSLLNVYSIIACNPETNRGVNSEMALMLVEFLTSREVQGLIRKFGEKQYGVPLFIPCAGREP